MRNVFCHLSQLLLSIKINVLCFYICDGYVEWCAMISLSHCLFLPNSAPLFFQFFVFFGGKKSQIKKKISIGLGGNIEEEGEKDGGSC